MKPEQIAIVSALGGVLIATLGNIVVSLVSGYIEHKREIRKLIIEMSLAEWKERAQVALKSNTNVTIYPLMQNLVANAHLVRLISRRKAPDIDEIRKILDHNKAIRNLIEEYAVSVKERQYAKAENMISVKRCG